MKTFNEDAVRDRIEKEVRLAEQAWALILDAAESVLEDDTGEDDREDYQEILDTAWRIIRNVRESMRVGRTLGAQ